MVAYLVLDCETTGLDRTKHGVITLSASLYRTLNDEIPNVSTFNAINMDWFNAYEINLDAMKVNGIKIVSPFDKCYSKYDSPLRMYRAFSQWLLGLGKIDYIVGININFDIEFIKSEALKCGIDFGNVLPRKRIDPQIIANSLVDAGVLKLDSTSSENLYKAFNIEANEIHDSKADVLTTWQLWLKVKNLLSELKGKV